MAIEARIRELDTRRQNLERAIAEELSRPSADSLRVTALKRQKLKLKEEIAGLQGKPH
jgi:hypothetical protein